MTDQERIKILEETVDLLALFVAQMALGRVEPEDFLDSMAISISRYGEVVPLATFLAAINIHMERLP